MPAITTSSLYRPETVIKCPSNACEFRSPSIHQLGNDTAWSTHQQNEGMSEIINNWQCATGANETMTETRSRPLCTRVANRGHAHTCGIGGNSHNHWEIAQRVLIQYSRSHLLWQLCQWVSLHGTDHVSFWVFWLAFYYKDAAAAAASLRTFSGSSSSHCQEASSTQAEKEANGNMRYDVNKLPEEWSSIIQFNGPPRHHKDFSFLLDRNSELLQAHSSICSIGSLFKVRYSRRIVYALYALKFWNNFRGVVLASLAESDTNCLWMRGQVGKPVALGPALIWRPEACDNLQPHMFCEIKKFTEGVWQIILAEILKHWASSSKVAL